MEYAGGGLAALGEGLIVGPLQLVVPPIDGGLRAQLVEILLALTAKLLFTNPVRDVPARFFERLRLRLGARLELQDLIATLRAKRLGDVAHFHAFEHLPQLRRELL